MRNFILGIAVGAIGMHLLHQMGYMGDAKGQGAAEPKPEGQPMKDEEAKNYSGALTRQYNILMPSDMVSRKMKEVGKEFTQGRYSIDESKINPPISI